MALTTDVMLYICQQLGVAVDPDHEDAQHQKATYIKLCLNTHVQAVTNQNIYGALVPPYSTISRTGTQSKEPKLRSPVKHYASMDPPAAAAAADAEEPEEPGSSSAAAAADPVQAIITEMVASGTSGGGGGSNKDDDQDKDDDEEKEGEPDHPPSSDDDDDGEMLKLKFVHPQAPARPPVAAPQEDARHRHRPGGEELPGGALGGAPHRRADVRERA